MPRLDQRAYLVFLTCLLLGCRTSSSLPATSRPAHALGPAVLRNSLEISIALPHSSNDEDIRVYINRNSHFHVVFTNTSEKPLNLLHEGNPDGWEALSFRLEDEQGNRYLIRRTPAAWTDSDPGYWILQPGEHYVQDVCFAQIYQGGRSWSGFPDRLNHGQDMKVKITAIYRISVSFGYPHNPVWHGRLESKPITCSIQDARAFDFGPEF